MIHINIDWKELGEALGLSAIDIEDICAYDRREHRQRLIETWYSRATGQEFSHENLQGAMVKVSSRRESYDSALSVPSTPSSPTGIMIACTRIINNYCVLSPPLSRHQSSIYIIQ